MKQLKNILLYKIIILTLIITIGITFIRINLDNTKILNQNVTIGKISNIKEKDTSNEIELENGILVITNIDIENINFGDTIKIEGKIQIPKNNTIFNLFNYKKHLKSKKINYVIYSDNIVKIKNNNKLKYEIKNTIYDHIKLYKTKEYLKTFILGQNTLESKAKQSYQNNGISHLFAISGMHLNLFSIIILSILNKMKIKETISTIIIIAFFIFFAFLTNYQPSIMRTLIMYILLTLNKIFKLNIKNIYLSIMALIIMLLYNPYYIYSIAFLYTFIISSGLMITNIETQNYIKKIFKTSLVAFILSIPISINNYNSINIMSPFINIIFIPYISFVVFPLSLLTFVIKPLDRIFLIIIKVLEYASINIEKLKFNITLKCMPWYITCIYYLLIIIFIKGLNNKDKKNYIPLLIMIIIHANIRNLIPITKLAVLDVGQGDSTLIELKNNNILIDTGGSTNNKISENSIIPYLKSQGIKKIDHLVLTHGDFDHMGEAINLVENFKVENVIFNCGSYNDLEQDLIKVLDKKKIKYYSCIKELNIDKYKLEFLNTKEYDNENDNSNVIYFNYEGYKFLFMGDAGTEKEKDILEKYNLKDIDFLKVGHHGSNTSSSNYFIDSINPKYSLISVGKNNRYGHPKDEVLDTLRNSKIYRTDLDGSIEIKLNKRGYKIRTCSP